MTRSTAGTLLLVVAVVVSALAGCSSDDEAPTDSAGASVGVTPDGRPTTEATTAPSSPAPTAGSAEPAPADEPTATPSAPPTAEHGCDPSVFTPTARTDVRRSATQLLGFGVQTLAPGGAYRARGYSIELFEALFSGIVDQDGAEVGGPLRAAVVERLGADVVRDGLEELRVPVRLRNDTGRNQSYVVYAFATRSEGGWTATFCREDTDPPEPTSTEGTFATWQRLDHGVVRCDAKPRTLSRVAQDAQLNGCG